MKQERNISFCIPTYNRIQTLKEAIGSIFKLKGLDSINYEILVSDDSNNDLTEKYIIGLNESNNKIKYLKNKLRGQFNNLNNLIVHTQYPWIVFLHDDDKLKPDYLLNIFNPKILSDDSVDIVWTGRDLIDGKGNKIKTCSAIDSYENSIILSGRTIFYNMLSKHDYTNGGKIIAPMVTGLAIKRSLVVKADLFDTRFEVNGDGLFLWRAFFLSRNVAYINNPFTEYRVVDDSERVKPSEKGTVFEEMRGILFALLDFLKPFFDIDENKKMEISFKNNFYGNIPRFNGPILWIALRYKGSYFKKLKIQLSILKETFLNMPQIALKPKTWIVFFVSFLPQKILRALHQFYLRFFT